MPRKKAKTNHKLAQQIESASGAIKQEKIPKSLVMRRGKTAAEVVYLVQDLRHLFLPYTALNFKEDARNRKLTLQQYASHLALPMGVSHMLAFSQNDNRLNLRLARTPEGPTLHFRVHQFSTCHDIKKLQRRPVSQVSSMVNYPPIVVTHQFGDASAPPHVKLMRITFQNMFPAINVSTVQLKECRRVVLFHYIEATDDKPAMVQWRHYAIKASPTGVHRRVRRLVQGNKSIPNLGKLEDIADYLDASSALAGNQSDSEVEDNTDSVVQLPDDYAGRGNNAHQASAIKLVELGPRLSMELVKVEKGLGEGSILYHAHVQKTPAEVAQLQAQHEQAKQLKKQRQAIQEQNVERKRQAAAEKLAAKAERKRKREEDAMKGLRKGDDKDESEDSASDADDDDVESEGEE